MRSLCTIFLAALLLCAASLSKAQCNSCAFFEYQNPCSFPGDGPLYVDSTASTGGTWSINTNDIIIDPVSGTLYPQAGVLPGTYTVTYTAPAPCNLTCTRNIDIFPYPQPEFFYPNPEPCIYAGFGIMPAVFATTDGINTDSFYVSPAGLAIDPLTGDIDVDNSSPGTYTVVREVAGPCGNTAVFIVEITLHVADTNTVLDYPQLIYCPSDSLATPLLQVDSSGFFPGQNGLVFHDFMGTIDLQASQPGTYLVRYQIAGVCPSTLEDTIIILPYTDPSFDYSPSIFCSLDPNPVPTVNTPGGDFLIFNINRDTLPNAIDPQTGEVYVDSLPTNGSPYTICYTPNASCTFTACQTYIVEQIEKPVIEVVGTSLGNTLEVNNVSGSFSWFLNGSFIGSGPWIFTQGDGTYVVILNYFGNCEASDTLILPLTNTPEPLLEADFVDVYPNPGNGMVDLMVDLRPGQQYGLSVFDLVGRLVYVEEGLRPGHQSLDLTELPRGTFLLRFRTDNGIAVKRYIKQ